MAIAPYNHKLNQLIKTDVKGEVCDRAFIAHYHIPASSAIAAVTDYILASTVLGEGITTIAAEDIDAQPLTPRVVTITGNAATVAGNVELKGKDANKNEITDTIAANGAATVEGLKAFAELTEIKLPAAVDAADEISIGISDAFGIPYMLPYNTVFAILNNATPTTVASSSFSATDLSANYINPTAALAGKDIDVYLLV